MKRVLVICGPTGVGKTEVAIEIAEKLGGEIISADSRQVYIYLDLGTAKPTPPQRQRVPHHLIDILHPDQRFTAADYGKLARQKIREILKKEKVPVVCGGSGLYLRALTEGLFDGPPADLQIRGKLEALAGEEGVETLYRELCRVDPASAKKIDPHDKVRMIRALEVFQICGKPISLMQEEGDYLPREFDFVKIGLTEERGKLYKKIGERVDKMLEEGLLEEVRSLARRGYGCELVPLKTVGYQEIFDYLAGRYPLKRAIELIKRNTRRYAKRQLTWFRKDKQIRWFEIEIPELTMRIVEEYLGPERRPPKNS